MLNGEWRISGRVGDSAFAIRHYAGDAFAKIDQSEKIDSLDRAYTTYRDCRFSR